MSADTCTRCVPIFEFCEEPGPELHLGITSMAADPGSMLKISIKKCDHSAEKNIFVSVANRLSMLNIFNYYHGHIDYSVHDVSNTTEAKKVGSNETYAFKIQTSLTVGGPHFKV